MKLSSESLEMCSNVKSIFLYLVGKLILFLELAQVEQKVKVNVREKLGERKRQGKGIQVHYPF